MYSKFDKLLILLFLILSLIMSCGKAEHHDNEIHRAQQQDQNNSSFNQ